MGSGGAQPVMMACEVSERNLAGNTYNASRCRIYDPAIIADLPCREEFCRDASH
jgi:hypothetical protein